MNTKEILKDIGARTNGEIYLGVVGPVRSGKSSFIRKFMEVKVLPYIKEEDTYHKVLDELPQSGEGKTIMTVEPKFVPSNNMTITIEDNVNLNIRLVDCVGYVIDSSKGFLNDDGSTRLVQTPWFSEPIPFNDAAGLGTKKVIEAHSNIGILLSSDGSFGDFTRDEYAKIEERMVDELKSLNKPFVLILNTNKPNAEETKNLVNELSNKYNVTVLPINVLDLTNNDVDLILKSALNEFDISELNLEVPSWVDQLDGNIPFKQEFDSIINDVTGNYRKMKDAFIIQDKLLECGLFDSVDIMNVDSGSGVVDINIKVKDGIYTEIIEDILGVTLEDKGVLIEILQKLKKAEEIYNKIGNLEKVYQVGYDVVIPPISEIKLEEPTLSKQSNRYGILINAKAEALLITKVDVESSFDPIIGNMEQAQILVDHMKEDYENNPEKLWNSEIFGRKLCDVISDGIRIKVNQVPNKILEKYSDGITKIINQNKGGVIAIVL